MWIAPRQQATASSSASAASTSSIPTPSTYNAPTASISNAAATSNSNQDIPSPSHQRRTSGETARVSIPSSSSSSGKTVMRSSTTSPVASSMPQTPTIQSALGLQAGTVTKENDFERPWWVVAEELDQAERRKASAEQISDSAGHSNSDSTSSSSTATSFKIASTSPQKRGRDSDSEVESLGEPPKKESQPDPKKQRIEGEASQEKGKVKTKEKKRHQDDYELDTDEEGEDSGTVEAGAKPKVEFEADSDDELFDEAGGDLIRELLEGQERKNAREVEANKRNALLDITLSEQQEAARKMIVQDGRSVFLTGGAGTGKSLLTRIVIKECREKYGGDSVATTATTGVAALHINGRTLHSWAGIGLGNDTAQKLSWKIQSNQELFDRWTKCRVLIVDEVSMLDAMLFDKIEFIARDVRGIQTPFGGLQLVVVGDMFQVSE